jgi:hypothetical protein
MMNSSYEKKEDKPKTNLETEVDQPYKGQVVVRVGTPFFKKDERIMTVLGEDQTLKDAIETAIGIAKEKTPEVAIGMKRLLEGDYQVRANSAPTKDGISLKDVAVVEKTADGSQEYYVVDIDLMKVQKGGLYKLPR